MKYQTSRQDMLLAARRLSYASAASLPLSFRLGDRQIRGIPADFKPTEYKKLLDNSITETVITGMNDKGLEIRAEILEYRDFPVCEYTVFFTNKGSEPTEILSAIDALDADFCGDDPILHHGNGDTCGGDGYHFTDDSITAEGITIHPSGDGTSCNGAFPYMRVKFDDYVLTLAVGWTGIWKASFVQNPLGINVKAGQKETNFKILPGETMRTPRMCLLVSDTPDETRSMNLWRGFYFAHVMPKQFGENLPPKCCMHLFNYKGAEFTGGSEDNQITALKRYIKGGVKPDLWWYDAGFYPCNGDWPAIGNWFEDKVRWPNNGLGPLGEECDRNGVDLMVWFEPERIRLSIKTEIKDKHREFIMPFKNADGSVDWNNGDALFYLGNPDALEWIIDRIDGLIKKWHIRCYRQDFNFHPGRIWRSNEEPDRLGAIENLHIQGYYKYWDTLLIRNPGLYLDSCASGGRRNDLETMRRAVPFQYTDVGLGDHAQKQKQHLEMFEWIPYFRAHTMDWAHNNVIDEFSYLNAITPAATFMLTCFDSPEDFALARKMRPIWKRAAEIELTANYFPQGKLTYNKELTDTYCVHFYDQDKGEGFVLCLRNKDCEQDSFTAVLGLEDDKDYVVEDALSGEKTEMHGADLKDYTFRLNKREGKLLFFTRIGK
ncbi:MAG: alpha-galactosidase [Lachnospiraceae bacterium]|nr:alpha-galactosidase [Lachnospiraceae bacterium]